MAARITEPTVRTAVTTVAEVISRSRDGSAWMRGRRGWSETSTARKVEGVRFVEPLGLNDPYMAAPFVAILDRDDQGWAATVGGARRSAPRADARVRRPESWAAPTGPQPSVRRNR